MTASGMTATCRGPAHCTCGWLGSAALSALHSGSRHLVLSCLRTVMPSPDASETVPGMFVIPLQQQHASCLRTVMPSPDASETVPGMFVIPLQQQHASCLQTVMPSPDASETVQDMFVTPLHQQHASHTLASRVYGPQPHMRSSSATGPHNHIHRC